MAKKGRWFGILGMFLFVGMFGIVRAQAPTPTILVDLDPASGAGIRIEGLVGDNQGRLYTADLDSRRLFRISTIDGSVVTLGVLPRPASGMAFDRVGNLYMASGDRVLRIPAVALTIDTLDISSVQTFGTGLPNANGLAFDANGILYVSGGNTNRIYTVSTEGVTRTFATGFISERPDQLISTNGLAFGPDGKLYSANTGTGAIERMTVNSDGTAGPIERFATSSLLLGADGITFATNGDLYVASNERNAVVRVNEQGQAEDVAVNGNIGPLEFPASPSFVGDSLYLSNFDIPRGSNAPNDGGIGASIAKIALGVTGAPLPYAGPFAPPAVATATPLPAVTPQPAPTAAPEATAPPAGLPNTGNTRGSSRVWWGLLAIPALLAAGIFLRRRTT